MNRLLQIKAYKLVRTISKAPITKRAVRVEILHIFNINFMVVLLQIYAPRILSKSVSNALQNETLSV